MPALNLGLTFIVRDCLARVRRWPAPPNWTFADWLNEVAAEGQLAALEALDQYDASRGVPCSAFVMCRVLARVLARYRREWAYARHCVSPSPEGADGKVAADPSATPFPIRPGTGAWDYEDLLGAIARLKELDRWVLDQLFWRERAQEEVARELKVSQPAISKRKQIILHKLRLWLAGLEPKGGSRL